MDVHCHVLWLGKQTSHVILFGVKYDLNHANYYFEGPDRNLEICALSDTKVKDVKDTHACTNMLMNW